MYTMAIDSLSRGLQTDADGVASAADLYALNVQVCLPLFFCVSPSRSHALTHAPVRARTYTHTYSVSLCPPVRIERR
eukprot:COSAG03_NODE_4216_length_1634_cov_1.869707_1_plen_77_part_00